MRNMKGSVLVLALLVNGVVCIDIDIFNGSYRNINIAIQNTVKEDDTLIDRIKDIFTKASRFLFEATRHQVYFGEINIIIPKSWSPKSEYKKIPTMPEMKSYITIDEGNVKAPHTKRKIKQCGSPGWYMYLPASFVLQNVRTDYGHHENVVVHEWGHLRWGLWDEYGMDDEIDGLNKKFYLKDDGTGKSKWEPVRCSDKIKGKVGEGPQCTNGQFHCDTSDTDKLIDESCEFCPDYNQSETNMSSIMAHNWIDAVTTFCDNDPSLPVRQQHSIISPSKHNEMCNSRSSWEVMRDHEDFKSATTLPVFQKTAPRFMLLQETVGYRVLVLDISTSMNTSSRLLKMTQAVEYIIKAKIPDYSWLGIVLFSTSAFVVKNLTQITSLAIRHEMISALPSETNYSTCIGCGIDKALNLLRTQLSDPAGSEIIVLSDGENNHGCLNESIKNAKSADVTIHSISVSQDADPRMISMAATTGGKHLSYLEVGLISITSAILEILPSAATAFATEFVTLVSEQLDTHSHEGVQTSFNIDSGIGHKTSIGILQEANTPLQVDISYPNGTTYNTRTSDDNIVFDIPDKAMTGRYNVTITAEAPSVELYVTSLPTSNATIRLFAWIYPIDFDFSFGELPVVEAEVMKGRAAVLETNVTAIIETTEASPCEVSLLDNGEVPDDTVNDGAYAGVIPEFCIGGDGRITAKIYVNGESGKTYVQDVVRGAGSPNTDGGETIFEVLQENFQRTVVTNEILVRNYRTDDITAPGRIKDVSIIDISAEKTQHGESRNFTITWTATGDDVNIGQAMEYELKISNDKNVLINDFSSADQLSITNTNFTPKASGEAEFIRIEIDAEESYTITTFFAVRAKDEAGNVGAVSNIISILVVKGYRMVVKGDVVYSHGKKDEKARTETVEKKDILKITSLVTIPVIMIIIAIFVIVKKMKAKQAVEDFEYNSSHPATTVSRSVFQSAQLESCLEGEQIFTVPFDSKSFPTHNQDRRMSNDVLSQSSCHIELCNEQHVAFNGDFLESDTRSLVSESSHNYCGNSSVDKFTDEEGLDNVQEEVNVVIVTPRIEVFKPIEYESQSANGKSLGNHGDAFVKRMDAFKNKSEFVADPVNSQKGASMTSHDNDNTESIENYNNLGVGEALYTHDIKKKRKKSKAKRRKAHLSARKDSMYEDQCL